MPDAIRRPLRTLIQMNVNVPGGFIGFLVILALILAILWLVGLRVRVG